MKKNNKIRVQSAQKGNQRYMFSSTHNNLNNHFKLPNLRKEKTDLNLDSSNIFFLVQVQNLKIDIIRHKK